MDVWATCTMYKVCILAHTVDLEGLKECTYTQRIHCLERFPSNPHKTAMRTDCPHQLPVEHSEWMLQCMHQYEQFFLIMGVVLLVTMYFLDTVPVIGSFAQSETKSVHDLNSCRS